MGLQGLRKDEDVLLWGFVTLRGLLGLFSWKSGLSPDDADSGTCRGGLWVSTGMITRALEIFHDS